MSKREIGDLIEALNDLWFYVDDSVEKLVSCQDMAEVIAWEIGKQIFL